MEFKSFLVLRHSSSSRTFSSSFVIVVHSIKMARHFPWFFIIVVKPAWYRKNVSGLVEVFQRPALASDLKEE
ncbi:hypothetical protein V1478_014673 [Vespula squamosa]|uniref:Uncharacterized protein n=1 Tax=Vespula squamosa TaxID=30214 RepID=A0ABD2A2X7_VESSQ